MLTTLHIICIFCCLYRCVQDSIQIFCATPKSLTFRRFGSSGLTGKPGEGSVAAGLTLHDITLDEQKNDKVGRISGEEALILLGIGGRVNKSTIKARMVVLDVRAAADFRMGALPESLNLPYVGGGDASDEEFVLGVEERLTREGFRNCRKVICVAGNALQTRAVIHCAELLVSRLGLPRVTALHNGIDIFKTIPGVLFVPNA